MDKKPEKTEKTGIQVSSGAGTERGEDRGGAALARVRDLIVAKQRMIEALLPSGMSAGRLVRLVLVTVRREPKLLACSPDSLVGAVITAAQLGLEPDGVLGQAYLVPFKREATLLIGYRGMLLLADRSGRVRVRPPRIVYEHDDFELEWGLHERIVHRPNITPGGRGKPIGVYVIAEGEGGHLLADYMTVPEVEHARYSGHTGDSDAWKNHWDEMAKKTVIRRAFKAWPVSLQLAQALALDEAGEAGVPQLMGSVLASDDDLVIRPLAAEEPAEPAAEAAEAAQQTPEPGQQPVTANDVEAAQEELERARQAAQEELELARQAAQEKAKGTTAGAKQRGRPPKAKNGIGVQTHDDAPESISVEPATGVATRGEEAKAVATTTTSVAENIPPQTEKVVDDVKPDKPLPKWEDPAVPTRQGGEQGRNETLSFFRGRK